MLVIALHNVQFAAFHGLHPQEKITGNTFVVNLKVTTPAPAGAVIQINDTIDYSMLYAIVKDIMAVPVDLLETLVQKITAAILTGYPQVVAVEVQIEKLNPPIEGFNGSTSVSYFWKK